MQLFASLANGAAEEEVSKILEVLDNSASSNLSLQELNNICKELTDKLPSVDRYVTFNTTNSLWINPEEKVNTNFVSDFSEYLNGAIMKESPSGMEGMNKINSFVNDKTAGLIPQLLTQPLLSPAVLLNTLYFKGAWIHHFLPENTREGVFTAMDGKSSKVEFMNLITSLEVGETNEFVMVDLPFGSNVFSMALILPKDEKSSLLPSSADWLALQNSKKDKYTELTVPKFDIEYRVDQMLQFFPSIKGMSFTKILSYGLTLDDIIHATHLKFNEEGCEGAGASAARFIGSSGYEPTLSVQLIFDRPFTFVLHERTSGSILFLGHISGL